VSHSGEIQQKVFISYRRSDTQGWADLLNERLAARFGQENVFYDLDAIPAGEDFETFIENHISECSILIALIGKDWAREQSGSINDGRPDYVEIEIGIALRLGKRVIPVLVNEAPMPVENLPETIKKLAKLNATKLRPGREGYADTKRLIAAIEKSPQVKSGKPRSDTPRKPRKVAIVLPVKTLSITLEPEEYKSALSTFLLAHFLGHLVSNPILGMDCWALKSQCPDTQEKTQTELPGDHKVHLPRPDKLRFEKQIPLWECSHDRENSILKLGAIINAKSEYRYPIDISYREFLKTADERDLYKQYHQNKMSSLRNPIERRYLMHIIRNQLEQTC